MLEMHRSWNHAVCGRSIGMCGYMAVPEDGRTCFIVFLQNFCSSYLNYGKLFWTVIYWILMLLLLFSGQRVACSMLQPALPCHVHLFQRHTSSQTADIHLSPAFHSVCFSRSLSSQFSWEALLSDVGRRDKKHPGISYQIFTSDFLGGSQCYEFPSLVLVVYIWPVKTAPIITLFLFSGIQPTRD